MNEKEKLEHKQASDSIRLVRQLPQNRLKMYLQQNQLMNITS